MRHFLRGELQHLLANQLGNKEALGLVCNLVLWEVVRPFRQRSDDRIEERVEALFFQRRNWNDLSEAVQLLILRDQGQQPVLLQRVDLVQKEETGQLGPLGDLKHKLIARAELLTRIHDQQQEVATFHSVVHLFHHAPVERIDRLVDARRIDKDDLS